MRKAVVVCILIITLLSMAYASAATLNVEGGTIQVFTYSAEVLKDSQPARMMPTPTPAITTTPDWDGSRLAFAAAGFSCEDGYRLFIDAANTGKAMRGASEWKLLLEKTEITRGTFPALGTGDHTRLEYLTTDSGTFLFVLLQRPGFPGDPVLSSLEISVGPEQCPPQPAVTAPPTATQEAPPVEETTPVPLPAMTDAPTATPEPTEAPPAAETPPPTVEPTLDTIIVDPPNGTPPDPVPEEPAP